MGAPSVAAPVGRSYRHGVRPRPACVLYEGDNGYCVIVSEVDVALDTGRLTVKRLVLANGADPISNPDGIRNQLDGGALHGVSRALLGEVTWDEHKITSIELADVPGAFAWSRRAEDRNGSHQPNRHAGYRCRRDGGHSGRGGDWQRRIRCRRCTSASSPVHARAGQRGSGRSEVMVVFVPLAMT